MTKPIITTEISMGTIIQLVVILVTGGIIYGQLTATLKDHGGQITNIQGQTTRIEHYLSSEDKEYWHKTADNGDAGK